jgi:hypothetical protein
MFLLASKYVPHFFGPSTHLWISDDSHSKYLAYSVMGEKNREITWDSRRRPCTLYSALYKTSNEVTQQEEIKRRYFPDYFHFRPLERRDLLRVVAATYGHCLVHLCSSLICIIYFSFYNVRMSAREEQRPNS